MSLSFPLLVTVVPLYAVNYTPAGDGDARGQTAEDRTEVKGTAEAGAAPSFDVNWFSDGGICANLPVHFFNAALPTRPTFAIDLENFRSGARRRLTKLKTAIFQSETIRACCGPGRSSPPPAMKLSPASKRSGRSCPR